MKVKEHKNINHGNINQKRAGAVILIFINQTSEQKKKIARDIDFQLQPNKKTEQY